MGEVFLIPSLLHEDGLSAIPASVLQAIQQCEVFFVENERTTRRYFKKLWPAMEIDRYEWFVIAPETHAEFRAKLKAGKRIGIVSEAGCPGVADPGQELVAIAQKLDAIVHPLVGPSSILLALMASGFNGQRFQFLGYLPVQEPERRKAIREAEQYSAKQNCTQLFIETPYRNHALLDALLKNCQPATMLCLAVDLTGRDESIHTYSIAEWKTKTPSLHKRPAMFLLHATR